jgi:Flp pilus assembly protein TadG
LRVAEEQVIKMSKKFFSGLAAKGRSLSARFLKDKSGAAAIEFAFIAPLLITMYLGTMEISQGVEINKKVGRSSGVIGDLIGQKFDVTKADLNDIMAIGKAMLQPYNRTDPTITISLITIGTDLQPKVTWSRRGKGTTYTTPFVANSNTTVPANLKIASTYLIRVQTELEYLPITSWSIQKNKGSGASAYAAIDMSETYHLRPRVGDTVNCTDC